MRDWRVKKSKHEIQPEFDFGHREFVCKNCSLEFALDWETIFATQECTHGYVGYEYGDYYIECPRCGQQVQDDEDGWLDVTELF